MYFFYSFLLALAFIAPKTKSTMLEHELLEFLQNDYEEIASDLCTRTSFAQWNHMTDLKNPEKQKILNEVITQVAEMQVRIWEKYFKDLRPEDYRSPLLRRQIKLLKILGEAALGKEKLEILNNATNQMTLIYSTAKICPYDNQQCDLDEEGLRIEPDITDLFKKCTDYDELVYLWKAWRDASGAKMEESYKTYVELSNEAAVANGFRDMGEMWRDTYESPTFVQDIDDLWAQVEPLYKQLHRYVGNKLKDTYGAKLNISNGLIPAHVFGNMWAQDWSNIAHLVKPFPEAISINLTSTLIKQQYTVLDMFQTSNYFYKSLGLLPNDIAFNTSAGAMIEKPIDREVVCHPSAMDFCDGENYRMKMCAKVDAENFIRIHHEMGHIQYYLQYAKQPYIFRGGPNGFHESIGDTITLSVLSQKHLARIGLLENFADTYENSMNALMDMALRKVAFLPFTLLVDKWRWDVFSGSVQPNNWNEHWWEYRKKYQGIKPPVQRIECRDFDPGAKFHVPQGAQYIPYFVALILQFQFYKTLCIDADEYNPYTKEVPLYECDFYYSSAAGNRLRYGLSLGASQHWSYVLESMTGQRKLDASAMMEYFEPLHAWLIQENMRMRFPRILVTPEPKVLWWHRSHK